MIHARTIMRLSVIILFALILGGCFSTKPRHLGYFEVEPFSRPFSPKVDAPFAIMVPAYGDTTIVEGEFGRDLLVIGFRKSLIHAFEQVVQNSLANYRFIDSHSNEGFTLIIHRIKPTWVTTNSTVYNNSKPSPVSTEILHVKYESSLFYDGAFKGNIDGTYLCDDIASTGYRNHATFKACISNFCEHFHSRLLEQLIILRQQE